MTRAALQRLRAGPRRAALAALGVVLASAMAGAAITVGYGLHTGFDRAARQADLPDVMVRFSPQRRAGIDGIVSRLPNVAARSYRTQVDRIFLSGGSGSSDRGAVELVDGRRGYAIVAGRDVDGRAGEAVVDRGVAREWGLRVGDRIEVGRLGRIHVAGIAVSPDNVAYPLSSIPHVYVSRDWLRRIAGFDFTVNRALIWTHDPAAADVLLQQARATSTGISDVRFLTRAGVRVLIDSAAGIVIALLVAFSLVAIAAAGVMLAAGAGADVQRRLQTIGLQRAIGVSRAAVAAEYGIAAALVGLAAGTIGLAAGSLAAIAPSARLLEALNEQPPGAALLPVLAAALAAITTLVGLAAAWPAWRATGRPVVALLRGAELAPARPRRIAAGAGFAALGARLAVARRGRAAATLAVLTVSGALVLLMLGLASLLSALRDDPGTVGKRYQLTTRLPADAAPDVRAVPGVAAAAPRWVVRGADSFSLGEPVKLLAFEGDHTRFEDPPLAAGRRLRSDGEAEIGVGLAQALGLAPGATLAVQMPSGGEARFRVVGTVRALEDDGRVAYVRPRRVLDAEPGATPEIAVRLRPGADRAAVSARLRDLGAVPAAVGGATTRNGAFLGILATLLRVVAAIDALVCLYALAQALALTARERRPTLALLRATGASARTVGAVLAGAGLAIAVPAAVLAVALEHWALAPLVGELAAGYADLAARPQAGQAALVLAGMIALALAAAAWVARRAVAEPPVAGLREE
ncbi:MAG: putative transport system permease protein [Solirubrobacteraceae bacterium]|nr:putative transport system permease protein [Solirubrobacteraceae bacterium]